MDDKDSQEPNEVEPTEDTAETEETAEVLDPVEALKAELNEVKAKLRVVSKAYQEREAEMAAFRKRMQEQTKIRAKKRAGELVKSFFDPVQNLKRSVTATESDPASLKSGLEMILHQFNETLKALGLEEIKAEGSWFDPNLHEALGFQPVDDAALDGVVMSVHKVGYRVGNQVLQPSQVVVGKKPEDPVEE